LSQWAALPITIVQERTTKRERAEIEGERLKVLPGRRRHEHAGFDSHVVGWHRVNLCKPPMEGIWTQTLPSWLNNNNNNAVFAGIGAPCRYGAFIPTDRAYYNVRTPRASGRRPSSEQLREYRRQNVTGGIDTHRSNISFGKTTESVRGGLEGDPRAREATKCLTSGEVTQLIYHVLIKRLRKWITTHGQKISLMHVEEHPTTLPWHSIVQFSLRAGYSIISMCSNLYSCNRMSESQHPLMIAAVVVVAPTRVNHDSALIQARCWSIFTRWAVSVGQPSEHVKGMWRPSSRHLR